MYLAIMSDRLNKELGEAKCEMWKCFNTFRKHSLWCLFLSTRQLFFQLASDAVSTSLHYINLSNSPLGLFWLKYLVFLDYRCVLVTAKLNF